MVKIMFQSMTGYGQSAYSSDVLNIQIDIKSVNHRYQETMIRMPKDWFFFEERLKKKVQEHIKRGRVDLFITIDQQRTEPSTATLNWPLIQAYTDAVKQIKERYPITDELKLQDILQIEGAITFHSESSVSEELLQQPLLQCLDESLRRLLDMREIEGQHLFQDLQKRLQMMKQWLQQIIEQAPHITEQLRVKTEQRIKEVLKDNTAWEEQRFQMEIAVLVERADITEELTRLQSHVQQFDQLLRSTEPVGRKLDFLIQEMNREVNTIGSKANHTSLTSAVIEMKSELEKMREQVQNVQ